MTNNYTETFRSALEQCYRRAKELGAVEITPDLLLYGVLKEADNSSYAHLKEQGFDPHKLLNIYETYIEEHTPRAADEAEPALGNEARELIAEAVRLCGDDEPAVSPKHLITAILRSDKNTLMKRMYIEQSVHLPQAGELEQFKQLTEALSNMFRGMNPKAKFKQEEEDEDEDEFEQPKSTKGGKAKSRSRSKTPMLDQFGRDITALAREGKLDPVVGRENEISRMTQILGRRRKSNPILIGEPGVGKTSLVEGLAQRITSQNVPHYLIGKRLIELDLSGVVAGTKFRGQFEERIKEILEELEEHKDVIIYIDEIHTMIGAGGGSGSMDAANMLKPALARGGIQCIGATTLEEYRKHIEKDGALERRFQKVLIEPSSKEETLLILRQLKEHYEAHHEVNYSEEALQAMVDLAERYLTDRFFPDKAIDLMDEAGTRKGSRKPEGGEISPIVRLEEERAEWVARKLEAIKEQKFELAASYRNKERELELAISEAQEQMQLATKAAYECVTSEDVAEVISMMTGIPVQSVSGNDLTKLRELEEKLKERVIGQDSAVESLARSVKRSRLGLRDAKRPIGTFLFLGPTGVGKTHLVKSLAELLFDSTDSLIRVDMSEYMEKFAVSRLVGAPPGYVGYDEGGQLTERVRRRPYSVVLFDEIEKAHPDVFNLLLQILDEGVLTDSYGHKVDFRNTIIVITSNVGSREAKDFARGIGYQDSVGDSNRSTEIMKKALGKAFSPEFLNRLDEIITFSSLDETALRRIIEVELNPLRERLNTKGYSLELDDEALEALCKIAYDPKYGARPLRRALQQEVEDRLTDLILEGRIKPGEILRLTAEEGKLKQKGEAV